MTTQSQSVMTFMLQLLTKRGVAIARARGCDLWAWWDQEFLASFEHALEQSEVTLSVPGPSASPADVSPMVKVRIKMGEYRWGVVFGYSNADQLLRSAPRHVGQEMFVFSKEIARIQRARAKRGLEPLQPPKKGTPSIITM